MLKNHICWIKQSFSLVPTSSVHGYIRQPVCCEILLFLQNCSPLALFHRSLQKPGSPPDDQCQKIGVQQQILWAFAVTKGIIQLRGWKRRCCLSPGAVNIPGAMVGIVVGGAILKRFQMSLRQCSAMCVLGMFLCLLLAFPLLFLGCPTQKVAGVTYSERYGHQGVIPRGVGNPHPHLQS